MSNVNPYNPQFNWNPVGDVQLSQLNQARIRYLNSINQGQNITNQKSSSLLPYAVPEEQASIAQTQANTGLAQANTGLASAQTQMLPATTFGQIVGGLGRLGYNVNPGAAYRSLPPALANSLASNNVQGISNVGAINNPNLNTPTLINNLFNRFLGGNLQSPQNNNASGTPSSTNALPVNPGQIQQLQQMFGNNSGGVLNNQQASSFIPAQAAAQQNSQLPADIANPNAAGSSGQTQQVVDQLSAAAQNATGAPALQQKYNYANNLMTTLTKYGNPAITFAKYMGPAGWLKYQTDLTAQNPSALNFRSFLDRLRPLGGDQARQFFAASVQPSAMDELNGILNPQSFRIGAPGAAKAVDDVMDVLRIEGGQAAQQVGRQKEFNSKFPAPTTQDYYKNISDLNNAGASGKTYFQTLTPAVQAAIQQYHQQRNSANG